MTLEWGSVSLLEVFWTVFALVGVGVSLYGTADAKDDRSVLPPPDGSPELETAYINTNQVIRNERVRLGLQTAFTGIGFTSMTLPQTNPIEPARLFLTLILLAAPLTIMISTWLDRRDRRKCLELLSAVSNDSHR